MLQIPYLHDIVIIFGSVLVVIALCFRLRIPYVVGFLITGALVGPHGLGLVNDTHHVEIFAELGVVFLLFVIGLELSLDQIKRLKRIFLLGGSSQAIITTVLVAAICYLFGLPARQGVYFGFLACLSSTAIVLKLYFERGELSTPQGQVSMGILLFQDILIVPLLLVIPVLAGTSGLNSELLFRFGSGLAIVAVVFAVGRYLVPHLLYVIVQTGIRELFVIAALFACLGAALLTEFLGFSMALGAFLAGILLSESDYRHQLLADMSSIRDFFTSMFFISIGMLLRLNFAYDHAPLILGLVAGLVLIKTAVVLVSTAVLRYPLRTCIITALGLAQIGEFSFVLIRMGQTHGLLDEFFYQLSIASTVLSMLLTPLIIGVAPSLAQAFDWAKNKGDLLPRSSKSKSDPESLTDHVIVVGFGLNGRHLARVLKTAHCPYVVVDLNGHKVRKAKLDGEPILYGDITRREILEKCDVKSASIAVFAISDPVALRRSVRLARDLNPDIFIVVRSWRLFEIEELQLLGANQVIAQEFETSIEIVTIVLTRLHLPGNIIRAQSRLLRADGYQMLRAPASATGLSEKVARALVAGTTDTFLLSAEHVAVGKSIRDIGLRQHSGATIIAVVRGEEPLSNPQADLTLKEGDVLVLVGSHAEIERAFTYLEHTSVPSPPQKLIRE